MRFFLFLVCFAAMLMAQMPEENKLLPAGETAPSFSLPMVDGDRLSLSMYCGAILSKPFLNKIRQTVIVSFWATYCKPCQKEIPELIAFAAKHQNENVTILCVSIDKQGAEIVEPFVKEKNYTLPVLLDPYAKTAERYGVKSLPALFVIDTMGIVRFASSGYNDNSDLGDKLEKIVAAIKEGKPIPYAKVSGASVPISTDTQKASGTVQKSKIKYSAKQKLNAVARVECGEKIDKVASSVGVTTSELHTWCNELQKTAADIWGAE